MKLHTFTGKPHVPQWGIVRNTIAYGGRRLSSLLTGNDGPAVQREKIRVLEWIHPETKKRAVRRAWDRANSRRWTLETALFLFAVLIVIILLGFQGVDSVFLAPIALIGLCLVWMLGRYQAKKAYTTFISEELIKFPDEWKDYYRILEITPGATQAAINEAYERKISIFRESASQLAASPVSTYIYNDTVEAYNALSDSSGRIAYNYFWYKYNSDYPVPEGYTRENPEQVTKAILRELSGQRRRIFPEFTFLNKTQKRFAGGTFAFLLVVLAGGTAFAMVHPEHTMAAPFRGTATTVAQASIGIADLFESIHSVAAATERKIVSTALQSMRIQSDLVIVPEVTIPSNDMAVFPSPEHALFPEYLEGRYCEYRYTVDKFGIVTVDTTWAATDTYASRMEELIEKLRQESSGQ